MCGLLFCLGGDVPAAFLEEIARRGPDVQQTHRLQVPVKGGDVDLTFSAAVLGLRGELTPQPLVGKGVLGWNGQVFEGMQGDGNDTAWLMGRLEAGVDVLDDIEGPYAMVYYETARRILHIKLDPLHRRSLLVHYPTPELPTLIVASVRPQRVRIPMQLVEAGFSIHMDDVHLDSPTNKLDLSSAITPSPSYQTPRINRDKPEGSRNVSAFIDALSRSVKLRIENIPGFVSEKSQSARLGILFSGGIDCTMVAYLANRYIPLDEPIDLLNVAFENPRSLQAAANAQKAADQRATKLKKKGLDVPVDKGKARATYDVPDRLSAREAVEELSKVCPGRAWRLVEVDITYEECNAHRERVKSLMYPADTEMDLSLALPLYFASRGVGSLNGAPYASKAKVLLSGLGADEQLGGYSRHRRAFERESWTGLIDEIQMDIDRLPSRNLSRDDRIISSNAKDARYPFLSLSFIEYLSKLPVELKCDPRLGEGEGDKILLRESARSVGLVLAADRKKRAMQFGTRSAKMTAENTGRGGGDRKVCIYDA